jgi:hypothetical protein
MGGVASGAVRDHLSGPAGVAEHPLNPRLLFGEMLTALQKESTLTPVRSYTEKDNKRQYLKIKVNQAAYSA